MADAEWSATIVDRNKWYKSNVVDPKAKIEGCKNWSFLFNGSNVQLEDGVELISNVHIEGNTVIGKGTWNLSFC